MLGGAFLSVLCVMNENVSQQLVGLYGVFICVGLGSVVVSVDIVSDL